MGRQRPTAEQIIGKLWEAEVQTRKGKPLKEVVWQMGISDATYYHEVMALPQMAEGVRRGTG